jgi:hypothetical protein
VGLAVNDIIIKTIPHKEHRYETPGDYWRDDDGTRQIRVSKCSDWRYELLIAVHELIEFGLLDCWCISEPDVKAFDEMFEKERTEGKHKPEDEPGDDPRAPYRKHHFTATTIERILAHELGVDWAAYDQEVMNL